MTGCCVHPILCKAFAALAFLLLALVFIGLLIAFFRVLGRMRSLDMSDEELITYG